MQCPRCQVENDAGARFCEDCGARLEAACPSCGTPVTPGKKFCRSCGAALKPEPSRFGSPESYTPKYLAEKILTSKSALEGERKQVTVLFADLKGSMELLADRDPEDARKLLDPVLERMMEAVHRYEGTVNQVMGDGIMALFGAPLAHEDHAVRACYAALRMQESVKRYAEGIFRTHGLAVRIRVGLNSGEVVVRSIGSDLRMDYTAVGQTTHLAARMEQMADPGAILLTTDTLHLAEGFVHVQSLGSVAVKGLATPAEIFTLTGVSPMRTRLQAAAARGLTTFVGRDAEIDTLFTALEQAKAGKGQLVAVVGEPGVGKSRLFWEFAHSHRTHGSLVLEAASVSYGKATAYFPVLDLLKRYFQIEPRDETRQIREKVIGKLFSLDRALESCLAPLLWLLDVPVEDAEWERLDPPQRRLRLLGSLRRLVLREAQLAPVIVVFEDLHWIDTETQAFLDSLVPSLAAARLLLLVNYRPEYTHGWTNLSHYSQLRIARLGPDVATSFLDLLLGNDLSVRPLKSLLVERTEGNPFFLEESVRSLVETQHLLGDRGAYRLARPLEAMAVPATVRASLDARIDRLPAGDKRLLQCAAVIGKDVPFRLLEVVADLSPDELHAAVGRLASAELLLEAQLFPELELTFRHAVTHEVTYATLLSERRRELHARVLDALLQTTPAHGEPLSQLAHHAYRAERWAEAVKYLRRAAATALDRSAPTEAVSCLERALDALLHVPASTEQLTVEIDTRLELRNALFRLGRHATIAEHLVRAQALAERLSDEARLGWIHAYWAYYFGAEGDDARSEAAALTALASATTTGDRALELTATFHLAQLYARTAQYARAVTLNERLIDAGESVRASGAAISSGQLVIARLWLLWCLAELGSFDEGLRRAETLLHAAVEPFDRLTVQLGLGLLYLRQGRLADAIQALEGALPLCRTGDLGVWFPAIASPLGYAYALTGRLTDGLPLLEQAVEATAQRGAVHALRTAHLAEAHLLAGDAQKALELATQALEAARTRGERAHEAYALRVLGRAAIETNGVDAERHLRAAVELADDLRMRPLSAQARLDLTFVYERQGMVAARDTTAAETTRLLESMAMRDWLARPA